MSKPRFKISILATLMAIIVISCKENSRDQNLLSENREQGLVQNGDTFELDFKGKKIGESQSESISVIIDNYLQIKNALVADDQEAAASAGGKLAGEFEDFDKSNYSSEEQRELKDIIEDAKEHAELISASAIDQQREHFEILSKGVLGMIVITGTDKKLYQDFCPMYNNNKGAAWLSSTEEIKNPYFGKRMLKCGSIYREIN